MQRFVNMKKEELMNGLKGMPFCMGLNEEQLRIVLEEGIHARMRALTSCE